MSTNEFWPGGARLAVTISMQFEAGGQPISGASGPVTDPIAAGYPDLPQNSFYDYGVREGRLEAADDVDQPARPYLRARLPGARARPLPDLGHAAAGRVVGTRDQIADWALATAISPHRSTAPRPRRAAGPGAAASH